MTIDISETKTADLLNELAAAHRQAKKGENVIYAVGEKDTYTQKRIDEARAAIRFGFTPVAKPTRPVDRSKRISISDYGLGFGDERQWIYMLQKV
jgi:hypothetical protein